MTQDYEVVVVSGGPAGLSGALALVRARRSVLVIDAGQARNAPAEQIHTYLGREGTSPADLLATGRSEVASYGGTIVTGTAVSAQRRADGRFRVALADGSEVTARRLLIATGLRDDLPAVPRLAERWGRDVLHCPYCHGWEVRDQAIGVLGTGPLAVLHAQLWRQWSASVTLFTNESVELADDDWEQLAARGIAVAEGRVTGLRVAGGRLAGVTLAGGTVVACQALAAGGWMDANAAVLADLGLLPAEQEMAGHPVGTAVAAGLNGATAIPGVWVAGNVTSLSDTVIVAAAAGLRAGAAVNADLVAEETRTAVAARRAAASTVPSPC